MKRISSFIKTEVKDYQMILRSVPPIVLVFFVISIIFMNIFANKELVNFDYLALDCGFFLSWLSFLCMDMLTKRFGARVTIKISLLAMAINLFSCFLCWLVSLFPGNWGAFYTYGSKVANDSLNSTVGGTAFVLFGSMLAFLCSSITNATINAAIGKLLRRNTFAVYACRSYVSTIIGQIVDNMVFAFVVSHTLFGWTVIQCIMCSLVGAIAETLSEIIFSPVGYKVCRHWEKENIGHEYIDWQKTLEVCENE